MVLWRISRFLDLSGIGGLKYEARWHFAGVKVVYFAESSAGALLEICAHTLADELPPTFILLKVVGPDVVLDEVGPDELPVDWARQVEFTQGLGTAWLANRQSALLRVPSALAPQSWNYLLNPEHPDARLFAIERSYEYPFDLRLKG